MDKGRRQRGFKFSAGDWTCSDSSCRNVNFARRDRCNLCNKERDDRGGGGEFREFREDRGGGFRDEGRGRGRGRGGGAVRGGGGGALFAPDDWDCSKCNNVNWARRDRCFRCNTPRSGSDRGRDFDDDEIGYNAPSNGPFDDDFDGFKGRPKFGGRPSFDEDECGPLEDPPFRNGSRFDGPRRGGGDGGFRGRGRGRGGFTGRGRGRGGGDSFRGRDRSRSPLDRF